MRTTITSHARTTLGIVLAALALAAGCGGASPRTSPALKAERGPVERTSRAAEATVAGVTVIPEAGGWLGDRGPPGDVTPLFVAIENDSDRAVALHYRDFVLVTEDGRAYAALPVFDALRRAGREAVVDVRTQDRALRNFFVAPYDAQSFPALRAWPGTFEYDDAYDRRFAAELDRAHVPSFEMIRVALPEGVLDADGLVSGFLYFERLPDHAGPTRLEMHVETPEGARLGIARVALGSILHPR